MTKGEFFLPTINMLRLILKQVTCIVNRQSVTIVTRNCLTVAQITG